MVVDGTSAAAPDPPDTLTVSREELLLVLQGLHLLEKKALAELNEYYRSDADGAPLKQWDHEETRKRAGRAQQVALLLRRLSPF